MHNPALNPAVRLSPVENGYVAYDTAADRLHELNPVAALIVELCDGSRTIEEVRGLVKPVMPEGAREEEVDRWIKKESKPVCSPSAMAIPQPVRNFPRKN
jgi:coenzyme PQQ synthesis protein D (PqqD)